MSSKLMSLNLMSFKINVIKINVILNIISYNYIDDITKMEIISRERLVEQFYNENDKAIKDYKFRRGVSSDFYERVAKPVIEKTGEQIKKQKTNKKKTKKKTTKKKQEEQAEKITEKIGEQIEQMQGLPLPGPQMHPLPAHKKRSPHDTLQTQIKVLIIIGYQINIKIVSELVEIKNDADRLQELRKTRDMAATEARTYGNKARGVERRRSQNEETEAEKRFIVTQKKVSKNIIKKH